MPNRVLRDWTNSESFDGLSTDAEVFFTRLIMKADDFGGFYGNTKLLKAHLYPLKDFSHKKIERWIQECVDAGTVIYYKVEGKMYIRINEFGQRTRIMKSKFPEPLPYPPSNDGHMSDNGPPETKPNQTESESETETESETDEPLESEKIPFDQFWNLYDKKIGKDKCENKWKNISEDERQKIIDHVPKYKIAQPEKQFRKNPETYLNNKSWNDEIIKTDESRNNVNRDTPRSISNDAPQQYT